MTAAALATIPVARLPPAEAIEPYLRKINANAWLGTGRHARPACTVEPLAVTSVRRAVGLPFWQDLTDRQIETVSGVLQRQLRQPTPA